MRTARATAQTAVWFAGWAKAALEARLVMVGDPSKATGNNADAQYATRTIPVAQAAHTAKEGLATAAAKNLAAVQRWKAVTEEEEGRAGEDLGRARVLLADLVADIAPVARDETEARVELAIATAADATRALAAE
jgi:hypothetical protein